ncbi:hypothetical protein [Streptomyces sp. FH025]|uniref:hypothetical protein n=1 Tax=Streptomyces sp. FH025 TaxID=2815937 RepID=UPI001A9EDA34|nr:hypothetical protein [Streptomyces sp. FH025]MBO1414186.1 hypothetical protein [Streptomyces sp. FH025]
MNPNSEQPDVEQVAAVALRSAAAYTLADLAVSDDRYDQMAAIIAASFATEAPLGITVGQWQVDGRPR